MTPDTQRRGGWTKRGRAYYARVRVGKGREFEPRMSGVSTDEAAATRAGQIALIVNAGLAVNREAYARGVARDIGSATSERDVAMMMKAALETCAEARGAVVYTGMTFAEFAERWTSGALHLDHPDHVAAKQSDGDINILKNRINPIVGPLPLVAFTLEDGDRVMRALPAPPAISKAYRRAVAQVVHRVLNLAVYPAKIIKTNPLPKGWLPKLGRPKAKSFLYPKEEAALLANKDIDIRYRLLMGFLTREGARKTEARLMTWADFDLENGTVTLDRNKTDSPRSWPLDPGVVRALVKWKRARGGKGPFDGIDVQHLGEHMRDWLLASGVTRPQLFEESEQRIHYRAHDTRSTFVTLSLANDKTEAWVMRRTAHKSSSMIARYTVAAANARELGLGPLFSLDKAIPELRRSVPTKVRETCVKNSAKRRAVGGRR